MPHHVQSIPASQTRSLILVYRSTTTRLAESSAATLNFQERISEQLALLVESTAGGTIKGENRPTDATTVEMQADTDVVESLTLKHGNLIQQGQKRQSSNRGRLVLIQGKDSEFCLEWCSCNCHVRSRFSNPWTLRTWLGRLDVQYTGQNTECNEYSCKRLPPRTAWKMSYYFPSSFANRCISLTIDYSTLNGPQVALHCPRVVPWSHPLWKFVIKEDLKGIQRLFVQGLASPSDINPNGSSALLYAGKHKSLDVAQFLLQQGADPHIRNMAGRIAGDQIWDRALSGYFGAEGLSQVRALLKDTEHWERRGFSILHKVVLDVLSRDLHLELEASTATINHVDIHKRTALHWAVIRDDAEKTKLLLAFGADPNMKDFLNQTPLDFARSPKICEALLRAGSDVHSRNAYHRRTALHQLCHTIDSVNILDKLVKAGIGVDVQDYDGETPLHNAVYSGFESSCRRLIELGADVNATNSSSSDNPIHFAVYVDQPAIVELLLANGADYTWVNIYGRTIAHVAVRAASRKTIQTLAKSRLNGLDFSLRDKEGKTPADYLAERKILLPREEGIHEAFEKFVDSVQTREEYFDCSPCPNDELNWSMA